jgi:hypothetical protein
LTVEVDQMSDALHAMRIVTGGTGGLIIDDVPFVSVKALIGQNTLAAMTLVAEGVTTRGFGAEISQ